MWANQSKISVAIKDHLNEPTVKKANLHKAETFVSSDPYGTQVQFRPVYKKKTYCKIS